MAYRLIRTLGWIRIAVLFLLLAGFITFFIQLSITEYDEWYTVALFVLLLFSIQSSRRDRNKLRAISMKPHFVFVAEYLLLATPLVILLLFKTSFNQVTVILLSSGAIAWFPITGKLPQRRLQKVLFFKIIQPPFEWISGFRNKGFTVLFLLVSGILVGWLHLVAGWVIAIGLTGLIASFYRHCESKDFIRLASKGPFSFISKKVGLGLCYYGFVSGILWSALIVMYPSQWVFTGLTLIANILLLVMIIVGKYAFYKEHKNIDLILGLLFGVGVLCLMIPYLIPVAILLTGWLMHRGGRHLKEEVYAFY